VVSVNFYKNKLDPYFVITLFRYLEGSQKFTGFNEFISIQCGIKEPRKDIVMGQNTAQEFSQER
jgi:hypothetical protein